MEFDDDGYGAFGGLVYENIPLNEANVIIVGIPYESATSGKKGASFAPAALRAASKDMQTISRSGQDINQLTIKDAGNIPIYTVEGEDTRNSIEEYYDYLLNNSNANILALGGDHSVTYPILKSLAKKGKLGIIWFDAHRDVLENLSRSRFSHGSPLRRALELDNVSFENVLLVGTRYMDSEEEEFVKQHNIAELRMHDLEEHNFDPQYFISQVQKITKTIDYLYVSLDIDVLDPAFAPGTGTQVGGGMSTSQLMRLIHLIPHNIRCMDIMEVSPPLDHSGITIKATLGIITEILAKLFYQSK